MRGYRINYNFSNQVALITDSGRGIGEAVSRAFAKHEAGWITGQVIAVNGGAFMG
jgi:NAD(P)-dependent dehydrogenase (short-subunit alcohol dehydrogenase family)